MGDKPGSTTLDDTDTADVETTDIDEFTVWVLDRIDRVWLGSALRWITTIPESADTTMAPGPRHNSYG